MEDFVASKEANHVLQAIFKCLPGDSPLCLLLMTEMRGRCHIFALHRFGCRVLCRMIEHAMSYGQARALVDELMPDVTQLVAHQMGSPVVEAILEHGSDWHRSVIAGALRVSLPYFATDRCGSYVVEKALKFCSLEDRKKLCEELLNNGSVLAQSKFGQHVAKTLAQVTGDRRAVLLAGQTRRGSRRHQR